MPRPAEPRAESSNAGTALAEELRNRKLDAFAGPIAAAFGTPGNPPPIAGWFVDAAEVASVFAVSKALLVRGQISPEGRWQTSSVPVARVKRVDELWDGAVLTVVVEFDADRVSVAAVTTETPAGRETVGTFTANGYLLQATGTLVPQLSTFAAAIRRALH